MIPLRLAVALLSATPTPPAANVTWIEQAMASLTCTALATDAERTALAAPAIGETRDAAVLRRFFQAPPRDARHARYRHLATLSTVAWWAGRINDQELRGDALANILGLAQQAAAADPAPLLFRQIQQCALAQIVIVTLEQERFAAADKLAAALAATSRTAAVEDWPLLLALREARLIPEARTITARLATALVTTAGAAVAAGDSARASRLYAAISQALDAVGEPRARDVALQSLVLSGRPPKPAAAWSVFPVLFDAQRRTTSMREAMGLAQLVTPMTPPATLADQRAIFATMHRLAMIADAREEFEPGGQHRLAAFRALNSVGALDPPSLLFLRSGLAELLGPRDTIMRTVARARPAWGRETLADYLRAPATLTAQAATQFVSDAPARTIERYKIDSNLRALMQLHEAMPADRARIEDAAFRLAQLRAFGRLTLATLTAELARTPMPEAQRFDTERFFSMASQDGTWIRMLLHSLMVTPDQAPPAGSALWQVIFTLSVFQNETTQQLGEYLASVRTNAPAVGELATPRPLAITDFQRRLDSGEALVATLVSTHESYVFAITPSAVRMVQVPIAERELITLVTRLRAGLTPAVVSGATRLPDFDAAAAHELYRHLLAPVADLLQGTHTITWYGDGPLGSVPPAVLLTAPPPSPRVTRTADFTALRFLVDQHAIVALPDLALFTAYRDRDRAPEGAGSFFGVGAPMLAPEEIDGARRGRSTELAGALNGQALRDLPKLAESVDEIRGIAALFPAGNATLRLGPTASEREFVGNQLAGHRVIALATHGFLAGEVAGVPEPSLMLNLPDAPDGRFDGILRASEIAQLQLNADLVILSACNTATPNGRPRAEMYTGLAQAFFTAGARNLLVSHWPVVSGAAVQLTVATVQDHTSGEHTLARSLQRAMQQVRRNATTDFEAHPAYWAPFVIAGDGR
jgi:CHAT domain-containing protein